MFLWKYSCGYVIIKVVCDRVEKFLNKLLLSGISAHNVEKRGKNEFCVTLRTRDLDAVRSLAEETAASIRIVKRGGGPVYAACLKARPILPIFMLAAVFALLFLSRLVLAVRIAGDDGACAPAKELLAAEGVGVWTPISAVQCRNLEEKLALSSTSIAFAFVRTDGVILNVELVSANETERAGEGRACSIYADKDCIIRSLAVRDGREFVAVGEAVKKGQLLVSGDITPEGSDDTLLIHSDAEIIGEVAYRFTVETKRTAFAPVRSGKTESIVRIELFGKAMDSSCSFADYETEFESSVFIDACGAPLKIIRGTAYELILAETELDGDSMLSEAARLAEQQLKLSIPASARIISKTTESFRTEEGGLMLTVSVRTIERIGYKRYL